MKKWTAGEEKQKDGLTPAFPAERREETQDKPEDAGGDDD